MLNSISGGVTSVRASTIAVLLASLLTSGAIYARETAPSAALSIEPVTSILTPASSLESVVRVAEQRDEPAEKSVLGAFGLGMLTTASSLTGALTDGVRSTVFGTASLAGTVGGVVTDSVRSTVSGTVNAAGAVGGVMSSTMKSTVTGTANMAGYVGNAVFGNAVGGAMKNTVVGTFNAAGTVTGIVADTVRNTVVGTVNVAGAVAGGVGSTVSGVAKTIIDAPQRMIQYATTMLGTPYKWGGNTIESGLDCSGFVREVVQTTTGKLLPRTAKEMSGQGTQVAYTEMKPGDLVFFNTRRRPFSHVGIYLGDGRFMHGASGVKSGKQVRIDSFSSDYYRTRFNGARRVANPDQIAGGAEFISSTAKPSMN